jgi:hypothetical protein
MKQKEPLYRKQNTKARGVHHNFGGDAKNDRSTKKGMSHSLKKGVERGLDYTPLYRFLLSKVGKDWDEVYSEAISRLDKSEPIYHLVAEDDSKKRDYVCCGESSYYSGLFVDSNNILQLVNPEFKNEDLHPNCKCCTHTFNGKPFVKSYNPSYSIY